MLSSGFLEIKFGIAPQIRILFLGERLRFVIHRLMLRLGCFHIYRGKVLAAAGGEFYIQPDCIVMPAHFKFLSSQYIENILCVECGIAFHAIAPFVFRIEE